MAFKYVPPTIEQVTKRINTGGATGYDNFIKSDFETFTPKKGENWVRILPPTWYPNEHWATSIFAHYNLGPDRGSALCNEKMEYGPCPVCDYRKKMAGKIDDDELKELKWRAQSLAWIIDRENESDGPKLWGMSVKKCDEPISKLAIDRENGGLVDFRHPYDGYDVYFDRSGEGLKTQYGGFQLARRPSGVKDKWLDYIADNPVPTTLLKRSFEEVEALFAGTTPRKAEGDDRGRNRAARDDRERPVRDTDRARYEDDRPEPRGRGASAGDDDKPVRDRGRDDDRPARDRDEPARDRGRDRDDEPRRTRDEPEDRSARARDRDDEPTRGRDREPPADEPRRGRERLDDEPARETSGRTRAEELRERFSNRD